MVFVCLLNWCLVFDGLVTVCFTSFGCLLVYKLLEMYLIVLCFCLLNLLYV